MNYSLTEDKLKLNEFSNTQSGWDFSSSSESSSNEFDWVCFEELDSFSLGASAVDIDLANIKDDIANHINETLQCTKVPVVSPKKKKSNFEGSVSNQIGTSAACKPSRKSGEKWTVKEHGLFVLGICIFGKGDWKNISKYLIRTKTSSQVASHAQKYYQRCKEMPSLKNAKRRPSIHDCEYLWKPCNATSGILEGQNDPEEGEIGTWTQLVKIPMGKTVDSGDLANFRDLTVVQPEEGASSYSDDESIPISPIGTFEGFSQESIKQVEHHYLFLKQQILAHEQFLFQLQCNSSGLNNGTIQVAEQVCTSPVQQISSFM